MTAADIIAHLNLQPHPMEGGHFVETYRSGDSTCIYYLLTPNTCSRLHRLPGDEVFHFYLGDPVDQLWLKPDGTGELFSLGIDIPAGERPQLVVPGGVWQGARLRDGGRFALLGTTMAPAFRSEDYETGDRTLLTRQFPAWATWVERLTPA